MASKPGSKYHGLYLELRAAELDQIGLTFDEIEAYIEAELPGSAREGKAFWSNRREGGYQAAAWLDAGYHVAAVNPGEGWVQFERAVPGYRVERGQDTDDLRWTGIMIRNLRRHMRASQAELAEILGVRQQTVSEWENAEYEPSRASAKHLTLVAERSGFLYESGEN